jgi:hypothetical protein
MFYVVNTDARTPTVLGVVLSSHRTLAEAVSQCRFYADSDRKSLSMPRPLVIAESNQELKAAASFKADVVVTLFYPSGALAK